MKKQISKIIKKVKTRSEPTKQKILEGKVVSVKMQKTVVVEISRLLAHPLYGKLIKRDRKIKADTNGLSLSLGDRVKIGETKPLSATKYFKVLEVIKP